MKRRFKPNFLFFQSKGNTMSHVQNLAVLRALIGRFNPDTSISDKVKATMTRIEKDASGLIEIMTHPDPEKSSLAIDRIVNDEKGRLRDLIAKSRNEVNPLIANWRASADAERVKKANLIVDEFAGEIRSVFRAMAWPAQLSFMTTATGRLDGAAVAAVLNAPPVLSGLTPDQVEQFREAYLDRTSKSSAPIADAMQSCVDTFFNSADNLAKPGGAARHTGNSPAGIVQPA